MEKGTADLKPYVEQLLELYRHTPETLGQIRRTDRILAQELYQRAVPLCTVEGAFLLAASRRCLRAPGAPPLSPVRSLYYFLPLIEEVLANPLPNGYLEYLKRKLKKIQAAHDAALLESRP